MTVKLTRKERTAMARRVRREVRDLDGGMDDATQLIERELFDDQRFEDVPATDISDYAWAFARFLYPHEARYQ